MEALHVALALLIRVCMHVVIALEVCLVWLRRRLWLAPRRAVPAATLAQCVCVPHVAVVVPSGSVDVESTAFLCSWLVGTGSAHVTVYQHHGDLLRHAATLARQLEELQPVSFAQQCVEVHVRPAPAKPWVSHRVGHHHHQPDASRTVITLLTDAECGQDAVVGAVGSVARDVAARVLSVEHITSATIRDRLTVQLPDPQLALCFAGPSRHGLLPWHVKLTEFFSCGALQDFRFADLHAALTRFARVEQRYGA